MIGKKLVIGNINHLSQPTNLHISLELIRIGVIVDYRLAKIDQLTTFYLAMLKVRISC